MELDLYALLDDLKQALIKEPKPKINPGLERQLSHGWLLSYLLIMDAYTWQRWEYWTLIAEHQKLPDTPIPRIVFCQSPNTATMKHLEDVLNQIPRGGGGWGGWSSWDYFNYFLDWLLFGFGHPGTPILPPEPSGCEGASMRLYQMLNLGHLVCHPYDYLGEILCQNNYGQKSGFFPTPLPVVHLMVECLFDREQDLRMKTVLDPCVGTGRMILLASNHSLRLYGIDINHTVVKTTLVNGYLYAPWLVKPFGFLDGISTVEQANQMGESVASSSHKEVYQDTEPDPEQFRFLPIGKRKRSKDSRESEFLQGSFF